MTLLDFLKGSRLADFFQRLALTPAEVELIDWYRDTASTGEDFYVQAVPAHWQERRPHRRVGRMQPNGTLSADFRMKG